MLAQDPSEPLGFQTQPCNSKAVRGQVRSRRSPTNSGTATAGTQARGTTGRRDRALKRLKPTREARRRRSPWPPREMMSQPSGPPRDHLTQRSTTAPCPVSVALEQPGFQAPCPARPLSSAFLSPLSLSSEFFALCGSLAIQMMTSSFSPFSHVLARAVITDGTCGRLLFPGAIGHSGGCHDGSQSW